MLEMSGWSLISVEDIGCRQAENFRPWRNYLPMNANSAQKASVGCKTAKIFPSACLSESCNLDSETEVPH